MISGTEVMAALMLDPKTAATPPSVLEVIRPLVEYLPELLGDDLGYPLTLNNLMSAKLKYLRYVMENDFVKKAVQAMPEESFGIFGREYFAQMMQDSLEQLLPSLEELSNTVDMQRVLDENGLTEQEIMLSPKIGLGPEVLELYREGTATIEDVLRLQPGLIANNT